MSGSTKEIASGAVREIEPELRELFTKVVERDPREEMLLGSFNGAFTGVTGGIAMFVFATVVKSPVAAMLGFIVFLATTISCLISGVVGAMVPLVLKKFGADPATASSIVVTTFTDVGSLAVFLGLAALLIWKDRLG